ncbi:lipid A export ATP-binding/permease protein MsbA [Alteromonas sp. KC3]|uniref:lipid A export permease/ATP-binding protein MsbA n=1 Tax=unclassified Alteromonas TaxID=2614992 RepID=UPI001924FCCC|nr:MULTISPECIES: lipid A export permease/ATP-binding protein MsbA [unclassified Alteromonas]BCO19253.1 lipid A export ATP-binding/permease protein MsbA [Alteromonas sp. KC3]BCO23213.1 lipid A export ATP-binding/permease protein MsbA [Alteromonas sp. KC14]
MQQADNSDLQIKRFLEYLKAYKMPFLCAIIGMIGYSAVDTFVFAQLQPMIDESLGKNDHEYLRLAAYAIVPLFLLRGFFNFMGSYTLSWIGAQVVMRMRQQLFDKYIHLPVAFHDNHAVGGLISKVTYDTEQVANASGKALLTLVREGALVIGLLCVMFYYSWQLSLIFLLIGPLVAIIVSFVSKRFRVVSKNIQQSMGNLTSSVEQAVRGHKVVIMFGGQEIERERFKQKNNHNRQQTMKLNVTSILSVSSIQVIASIALAVVLYIASTPGMLEELTAGVFINVVFCMVMLLKPLKQLTTINNQFQKGMAACASIFEILDEHDEVDKGQQTFTRAKGHIEFDDVTFSYPGKQSPALSNVTFNAKPGQSIALVGRSGSGKSTISSLLTRFYVPQQGEIRLDGAALNSIDLKSLRAQFAVVSQNVTLFNDSIANNIAYGAKQHVSREQIEEAAKMAHVEEFLANLPDGLDTVIGENGLMLSGGQRQRIAIARAILAQAPILILDEATSALDTESERLIQDALETLQKRCTSIVVAHRLSTIENADCIMVVEQGRIIEQGKHGELLEKGGHYAQLHALQFGEAK